MKMKKYDYVTLRERAEFINRAAEWFHCKWGIPAEAYLECMRAYLKRETEYGWYLSMDGDKMIAGLGVIENDFHDRTDLSPNVCAVYTEKDYRCPFRNGFPAFISVPSLLRLTKTFFSADLMVVDSSLK